MTLKRRFLLPARVEAYWSVGLEAYIVVAVVNTASATSIQKLCRLCRELPACFLPLRDMYGNANVAERRSCRLYDIYLN